MTDFTVLEDTGLTGQLPGSPGNLTFFPVGETQTRDGVVDVSADGSFTYQPDQNFNGDDQFFFASVDADGRLVGFGAIDIIIEAVNDVPVADPVMIVTDEDVAFTGMLTAFDEEGADLTFALIEDDEDHLGVLVIDPDGGYTYTPDQDANGSDSFQFQVSDGDAIGLATFDVSVNPINDAPRFRRDLLSREFLEDTSISYQLIADDPEMDDVEIFLDPDVPIFGGDVTITTDGLLNYTPRPNNDSFEIIGVIARDEQGATTKETVYLNIIPVNDPPVVDDLSFEVEQGGNFSGRVIARDLDNPGRLSFRVSEDMPPSAGTVTFSADFGLFNYVANPDAPMTDSFSVIVSSGGDRVSVLVEVKIIEPEADGGTDEDDRLFGTNVTDVIMGKDGSDTIFGVDGDDQLEGGRGADMINGGRGDDMLAGGRGTDTLIGDAGADQIKGGAARDLVMGGRGRDVIEGDGGRDILEGDGGRDEIDGGAGFDIITGGRGADILTGNGGADRFVFGSNHGRDVITDFQQGRDKIVIETGFFNFDLLSFVQRGDDVQILTGGGRVTVLDDEVGNFQAADFIF